MSDAPETQSERTPVMAPWLRGLIAIGIILGLGLFSQAVAGQSAGLSGAGSATPTFGPLVAPGTRLPTPTLIRIPTRIPTRLPDSGTNRNGDMCTVIASEHAARPSVPFCATKETPQAP